MYVGEDSPLLFSHFNPLLVVLLQPLPFPILTSSDFVFWQILLFDQLTILQCTKHESIELMWNIQMFSL